MTERETQALTMPLNRDLLVRKTGTNMKKCSIGSVAILALLTMSLPAHAGDKVVYKKRTTIDLSASVIEGDLVRPEGSYIVNRKVSRFSQMIMDRNHFITELLSSVNDL